MLAVPRNNHGFLHSGSHRPLPLQEKYGHGDGPHAGTVAEQGDGGRGEEIPFLDDLRERVEDEEEEGGGGAHMGERTGGGGALVVFFLVAGLTENPKERTN